MNMKNKMESIWKFEKEMDVGKVTLIYRAATPGVGVTRARIDSAETITPPISQQVFYSRIYLF